MLGIVVVNYASHELVQKHLGGMDLEGIAVRSVVVDNFSSGTERAAISALAADRGWRFVGLPDNRGFGGRSTPVWRRRGRPDARASSC